MTDLIPLSPPKLDPESLEQDDTTEEQVLIFDKDGTTTTMPRRHIFYEQVKYVTQLPKTIWLAGNNRRLELPSGQDSEPIVLPILPEPSLWKRLLTKIRKS